MDCSSFHEFMLFMIPEPAYSYEPLDYLEFFSFPSRSALRKTFKTVWRDLPLGNVFSYFAFTDFPVLHALLVPNSLDSQNVSYSPLILKLVIELMFRFPKYPVNVLQTSCSFKAPQIDVYKKVSFIQRTILFCGELQVLETLMALLHSGLNSLKYYDQIEDSLQFWYL